VSPAPVRKHLHSPLPVARPVSHVEALSMNIGRIKVLFDDWFELERKLIAISDVGKKAT
jgi:hypothetical protein